jgi:hydrogenase nickel incorporation protein HypA/HybF
MHEYSLVQSLVARVDEIARAQKAAAVHGLRVAVGELSGVDPELLRTAYETFRVGTVCETASLELVPVAARWSCPRCQRVLEAGAVLRCAVCQVPARLTAGDALLLESIDMEVP